MNLTNLTFSKRSEHESIFDDSIYIKYIQRQTHSCFRVLLLARKEVVIERVPGRAVKVQVILCFFVLGLVIQVCSVVQIH